jgi:hypothetical protein
MLVCLSNASRVLQDLTVRTAIDLLRYEFDCGDDPIRLVRYGLDLTIKRLGEMYGRGETLADWVGPLLFWGGPTNRLYQGSLKTIVIDQIVWGFLDDGQYKEIMYGQVD